MRRIYNVIFALCVGFALCGCEKKINEDIISKGSDFSAQAREISQNLDKESYKDLADLFLDTSEIDFGREVFIMFGKNQCQYCDMLKSDIKKNPALQAKIKENFNPYYINISYQKTHLLKNFKGASFRAQTQNLSHAFGVNLTPQVAFIDKNGSIKYLFAGYVPNLEKIVNDAIARSAPMGDYTSANKSLEAFANAQIANAKSANAESATAKSATAESANAKSTTAESTKTESANAESINTESANAESATTKKDAK